MFQILEEAIIAINILEEYNKLAYLTGGCVRDLINDNIPHDWDITTSANPEETMEIFKNKGYTTIATGIAHGTVTVVINNINFEITTFRSESVYSDFRHPDSVTFLKTPEGDVKRRDFTMNGLLFNPTEGVLDYVGGTDDIKNKIIRAIGNPDERFTEDPLRILRAMRFSSVLGFEIEEKTSESMIKNKRLLTEVSQERLSSEFIKMLVGKDIKYILYKYSSIVEVIIPEIHQMIGFEQNNPHHCYDVWMHTIESVSNAPAVPEIRMTMLLHDIGKPQCHVLDSYGISHFYNHPKKSTEIASPILKYLKYPTDFSETVLTLIGYHDYRLAPTPKSVKKLLNKIGIENFKMLVKVKRADISAQSPYYMKEKLQLVSEIENIFNLIIEEKQCFSLKTLKINGNDLLEIGIPQGKKIGILLDYILSLVINGDLPNDREKLINFAKTL